MKRARKSRGFTLVELLVAIVVIAVLIALFVPAVMQSREGARRAQCLNNMRQIGFALNNYHEQHGLLPPAAVWVGSPGEPLGGGSFPVGLLDRVAMGVSNDDPDRLHANWLVLLLPSLEGATLAGTFDPRKPISAPENATARMTRLPVLLCPSDSFNGSENPYDRSLVSGTPGNLYARGNYAMNFGTNRGCIMGMPNLAGAPCQEGFEVDSIELATENQSWWGYGVGGFNKSFRFEDMPSGVSNTVAVDEIRAGVHTLDPRGAWALGSIAASLTARHGLFGDLEDAGGPNNSYWHSDDIVGCAEVTEAYGVDGLQKLNMPCFQEELFIGNGQATSRSQHPGGVHVLMCDASAHFVSDNVNVDIWHYMHTRDSKRVFNLPF